MDKWAEIRRLVFVEGKSKRSVCRQFGIHWDTLSKILEHSEPPGCRLSELDHGGDGRISAGFELWKAWSNIGRSCDCSKVRRYWGRLVGFTSRIHLEARRNFVQKSPECCGN